MVIGVMMQLKSQINKCIQFGKLILQNLMKKTFGKPTQKPLELLRHIILASTNKGDLILYPFTGSSTTGIMALELDRKFIGIDLENEYLDLSVKRFEQVFEKKEKVWQ